MSTLTASDTPAKIQPPKLKPTPPVSSSSSIHSPNGRQSDKSPVAGPVPSSVASAKLPIPPDGEIKKPGLPSRKHTMSSRISGMFRRDSEARDLREKALEHRKEVPGTISETIANKNGSSMGSGADGSMAKNRATTSSPASNTPNVSLESKPKTDEYGNAKRFWIYEDGTHEHFLKVAKRHQKLKDMMKALWGKKDTIDETSNMTLMHDWIQAKKSEDKAAFTDLKGGPNYSTTLVEKYGKCQEIVGHGAFGIVRVSHKTDQKDPRKEQLFAVKEFHKRPGESEKKYQKRLTSEFCISSSMDHSNVIRTLDLLQDDKGDYCEVMEYCAGGDLYTLIIAAGTLEAAEADCYFKQLMRGVEYMHEMGVAHRDLKPENLLLTNRGAIKITDFGNGECFRMAWEKEAHMTAGLCGSAPYIAPEEYVDKEFDPRAVDIWSCGIIYMAMRTGRHLWRVAQKGEDEFFTRYLEDRKDESGFRPIEILHRRQRRNVIYSVLDPNPVRRLTAHQVLQSEWIKEVKVCKAGDEGA